jgi:hypothetical protein
MAQLGLTDLGSRTKVAKRWISKAVKHPGVEKARAKRNGISTHAQLEKDAHSDNPTLRGRGNLGLRFEKGGDLHKGKKKPRTRADVMKKLYDNPKDR